MKSLRCGIILSAVIYLPILTALSSSRVFSHHGSGTISRFHPFLDIVRFGTPLYYTPQGFGATPF